MVSSKGFTRTGWFFVNYLLRIDMKINCFKLLILVGLFSVSAFFSAPPGFAENGAIKVICLDSASNPIETAIITVSPLGGAKDKIRKTDKKGEAEFSGLDDGAYRVFARQDGFEPALFEFVILKGSKPKETVTLKLTAGSDKELYFEDPDLVKKTTDLMNQAKSFIKENKLDEAEKLLKQTVEMDRSNPDALRILGGAFLQQSKFEEATAALNKAVDILTMITAAPQQTQAQQILDSVQLTLKQIPGFKGESALREKNFDQAIIEFTQMLKDDPNNPRWHSDMAIALASTEKIDEALASIDKAIQLKPGEKKYEELKNQLSSQRSAIKEQAEYQKMKALQDEGNKLLEAGDAAGALKKYEELRDLLPQDKQASVWRQIGRVQVKLNQSDAAVQSFKKSIELAKDEKTAQEHRKTLAQFYLDQKKYEDAVNALTDSKSAQTQDNEQTLWSIFKDSKDSTSQLAEVALERILKINPQNADACFELGQLYYSDGKEKDSRTKELLAKYIEIGKDQEKVQRAKDFMVVISRRNGAKSK